MNSSPSAPIAATMEPGVITSLPAPCRTRVWLMNVAEPVSGEPSGLSTVPVIVMTVGRATSFSLLGRSDPDGEAHEQARHVAVRDPRRALDVVGHADHRTDRHGVVVPRHGDRP